MSLRNEAPVAGIEGVVAVVSHHEIIIILEGIAVSLFPVDEELSVPLFEVVVLINVDYAAVEVDVVRSQSDGSVLLRDPEGTIVIPGPAGGREGEEHQGFLPVFLGSDLDVGGDRKIKLTFFK